MQFRFGSNLKTIALAYSESQRNLNQNTVCITDAIWTCVFDNGSVLALQCDNDVNPKRFDLLSFFFSTPEAIVKTRLCKSTMTPKEARHHKYVHTISAKIVFAKRGVVEDQNMAQKIHEMYTMVPRKKIQEVIQLSKNSLTPAMHPQVRRIVKDCFPPPNVIIKPVYHWKAVANKVVNH